MNNLNVTNKKIKIVCGIFLILIMFSMISAFDYNEDKNGNPFLESEFNVKVPSINIQNLFILQPSTEPINPEIGTIYFDKNSKRLRLYDGTGWYALALEKVSSISKQQVKEKVEKESKVHICKKSTECGSWGDCINNYQSMICVSIDENCNKYEDTETRDCISENKLPSSAKDSHDINTSNNTESFEGENKDIELNSNTESSEDENGTTSESEEECHEECNEVCEPGEGVCKEVCKEEEVCNEEEVCEMKNVCKEECTEGEEVCKEVCKEVCEIPKELFDIVFDLEKESLSKSDKLVAWITLQNFGRKYVPARLIYSITDENGKEIDKEFQEIRVYTDESIIKRFDNLNLKEGDYVLTLKVEYAGIVETSSHNFCVKGGIFNSIKRFLMKLF